MSNSNNTNEQKYKEEIAEYWDERSITFDKEVGHGGADQYECQLWKNHFTELLGMSPLRILDIGTGTGFIALNLAELGHQVTGIDLSEMMIEKATKKVMDKGLDAVFLIGDAERPDFPDNSFEVIICRHLYWTLLNPRETFDEWKRILTHNGRVLLIDGKKNPPKEERPKVYTNVHEGRIYSEELVEKVQGVDVTIEEIATNLASAGFINITSYSLDDIAQYHHDQSEEEDKLKYPENEVNIVAGVVRKD